MANRNPYLDLGCRYQIILHYVNDFTDHDFDRDEPKKQLAIDKAKRILEKKSDVLKVEIYDVMRPKQPTIFIERNA